MMQSLLIDKGNLGRIDRLASRTKFCNFIIVVQGRNRFGMGVKLGAPEPVITSTGIHSGDYKDPSQGLNRGRARGVYNDEAINGITSPTLMKIIRSKR